MAWVRELGMVWREATSAVAGRDGPIEATYRTLDGVAPTDYFLLWALRQRLFDAGESSGRVTTGFRRILGVGHAEPALVALESAYRVLTERGARRLTVLPPACGFITHDEIRLLSLCFAAQAGNDASALRQADALVGPERARLLFASIEQLTSIFARCSIRLSSSTSALLRAYH